MKALAAKMNSRTPSVPMRLKTPSRKACPAAEASFTFTTHQISAAFDAALVTAIDVYGQSLAQESSDYEAAVKAANLAKASAIWQARLSREETVAAAKHARDETATAAQITYTAAVAAAEAACSEAILAAGSVEGVRR